MPKRTPAQVAAKWERNASAAVTNYKEGIAATQVNPMQLAAAATPTWLAAVQAAAPKFQRNVGLVSKQAWQTAAQTKGATNFPVGIQAGQAKYSAAIGPLLSYITQVKGTLPARGTLQQNIARMTAFVNGMAKYQKPAGS